MAFSVTAVSISVSPLRIEEEGTDIFMTSAPSRLPASSNEDWVRVEASKNRLTWVRPRNEVRFLSTWRLSSTYSSERSSRPVMSAAERPSIPSRCRWPRTKVDFDAGVIKTRAIGGDGWRGKRQRRAYELSPGDVAGTVNASAAKSPPLDRQPSTLMPNSKLIALILLTAMAQLGSAAAQTLPGDFVYLRDLDASIVQDIRYAGSNNFM